jgi:hypothetical protein
VRGRKGGYQFLSIPYETEGCDLTVVTSCKPDSKPPLLGALEHSLTNSNAIKSDSSKRLTDHRERTAGNRGTTVDYRKSTENNRETTVDNSEQTAEESFDESNGYRSRATSSSEYSVSSNSSIKSLEELLADLMNTDITDPMHATENINFVSNVDNIIR